jgi:hypothetical protein
LLASLSQGCVALYRHDIELSNYVLQKFSLLHLYVHAGTTGYALQSGMKGRFP